MKIVRGRAEGTHSSPRSDNFTGSVWSDPVLAPTDDVRINNVLFTPGARTHWHRHERGQILHVTSGQGKVCAKDGPAQTIRAGDTVWIAPGEEHWHGADAGAYLAHYAVSLGETEWLHAVSEADYGGSASREGG